MSFVVVQGAQDLGLASQSATGPSNALLQRGIVKDNSYKNVSLGLVFTPASGLKLGEPELKGTPGSLPLLVTIAAWPAGKPLSGFGTIFYADALSYYRSDQRSVEAYLRKITRTNIRDGFALLSGANPRALGGAVFSRADFRKGSIYESVLARTCGDYALVFAFVGPDVDVVNRLISGTTVNLDQNLSGCSNKEKEKDPPSGR